MYRYFIFFALCFIAGTECCQPPPCHWLDAKPIENYYEQVVNVMISADEKIQKHCQQYAHTVKEDHKPREYKLIYPADGEAYEIKVKDRALMVRSDNCMGSLADVRVLPAYVDPQGGHYTVQEGLLIIRFPYKFDLVSGGSVCIPPDPTVITIQRWSVPTLNKDYEYGSQIGYVP